MGAPPPIYTPSGLPTAGRVINKTRSATCAKPEIRPLRAARNSYLLVLKRTSKAWKQDRNLISHRLGKTGPWLIHRQSKEYKEAASAGEGHHSEAQRQLTN